MSLMVKQDTLTTDSLAQIAASLDMGPLQEPEAVSFTFDTIGWPILGGLVLLGIVVLMVLQVRAYHKNRYRREALSELENVVNGKRPLFYSFVLLKRTAMHAYGRNKVGEMYGKSWYEFLDKKAQGVSFAALQERIDRLIYQDELPEEQVKTAIITNTKKWIKDHVSR
ncbi:DUF4381 domain-containing protein [Echinicola soli]|uniref:DUF4381 domain-containing protein n=1 Tax=Echinicola soli TaxID=2591634 RepID=A0A514CNI1_9BACT|nr:DUF4381 domain-containing protein [Echinicola soli]QDH81358.1 DUF4381 domain-containing protein [Echinicola soli]